MTARSRAEARERQKRNAMTAAFRTGLLVWLLLLALLAASVALAYAPLGGWHLPVGGAFALAQAALILLVFMDVRRASALTRLSIAAAVLFALVLFALTFNDLFHRG